MRAIATLRQAHKTDVPDLVRLLQRSWLVTFAPELPFEAVQVFAANDPASVLAEGMWPFFVVAVTSEGLAGVIQFNDDWIEHLHVDPRLKRQGLGSLLMDEAEGQIAKSHGGARLQVRAFNRGARAFYERRGYIETRRYPGRECGCPVENIELRKLLGMAAEA